MKKSLLLLLLFLPAYLFAQFPVKLSVTFASNSSTLLPAGKAQIDSMLAKLNNIPAAYTVELTGHADNSGADELNMRLSKQRAASVSAYFAAKKFRTKNIGVDARGEAQPIASNETDEGKARNRRVEIVLKPVEVDVAKALGIRVEPQVKTMDAAAGGNFTMASGSVLKVPAGVWADANGNPVQGPVTLRYTEYRDPADFILSGIPMSTNQGGQLYHFNSSGMFRIEAEQNGKPLKLIEGKNIDVDFKLTQQVPNTDVFSFDTAQHKWSPPKGLPPPPGMNQRLCGWNDNGRYCGMLPEVGMEFAIRFGNMLASNKIVVDVPHPGNTLLGVSAAQGKIGRDILPVTYRLVKIASTKKTTTFAIRTASGDSTVTSSLEDFTFVFGTQKHGAFRNAWWKTTWTDADFETSEALHEALLHLKSNKGLTDLAVKVLKNGKGKKGPAVEALSAVHSSFVNARDDARERSTVALSRVAPDGDAISPFADSLFCFFQNSYRFMDKIVKEDTLKFEAWIDYFNGNNDIMQKRYSDLAKNKDALVKKLREELRAKFVQDSIGNIAQQKALAQVYKNESLLVDYMRSVSVNVTGVWNCDQLARLDRPVMVNAKYEDEKGKSLEIICTYLVDARLNGALQYNGNYNYAPKSFPYSPYSHNTLILFDADNNAYVFDSDQFDEVCKLLPKDYTFKVRALKKMEKTDDLRAELKTKP